MRAIIIFLFISFFIYSCDEGLSPELASPKTGFGGTVKFTGNWDPNVNQTHVVAFKEPLLSTKDFNVFNLKYVSEVIPNGSQSFKYSTNNESSLISTIEAGTISYIAVAQSLKDTITLNRKDWVVVGLFRDVSDSLNPGVLTISEGTFRDSININCDFNNPPVQPPNEE